MSTLEEQIKMVAKLRVTSSLLTEKLKEEHEVWELANNSLIKSVSGGTAAVIEAEAELRELALKAYRETGSKAPAVGVGIREVTKLDYDSTTALGWAVEHKIMLKLDVSAFEKYAKQKPADITFVTTTNVAQATISPNLGAEENAGSN